MSLSPGIRLGPYQILSPIGAGGMGEVYRARDTRLDRIVALKVSREQFTERFDREARAVAALNHPHICHLYDVGPNYLVMELVEGAPLKGPLPLDKVVEYAGQILDALDAAHKKGITHRDLKPANILVTKSGIKLLDFGLAKQTALLQETDVTRALTGQGQILGTLQYMSPEQLQGKEVDARSDLFSFGCVLYEMLTGKRAFEGESPASVIAAILEREPAPLEVTRPLDRVVRRSLAKDPDQRFQTARDLKAALTWAVEQPPASPASEPHSRRWWIGLAATIALAVSALAAWTTARFLPRPIEEPALRLHIDPPEGGQFVFGLGFSTGGISVSPDGRTAAYVAVGNGKAGLWIHPFDSGIARLLPGTEAALYPFWSPDSKFLAFFAGGKLQRVDLAGGAPFKICDVETSSVAGGAWSSDGSILIGSLVRGMLRVPAAGGVASPLTNEPGRFPQMLPGGRFLYFAVGKPQGKGVYIASLDNPAQTTRLLTTDTNALYVPGSNGKSYLLFLRGATLLAQEFDPVGLKLTGEPQPLADPVGGVFSNGWMNVAASTTGLLLYGGSNTISRFKWLDRAGRILGAVGEPGDFPSFRLSPDGRRASFVRAMPEGGSIWLLDTERSVATRFTSHSSSDAYPVWSPDGQTIIYSSGFSTSPATLFRKRLSGTGGETPLTQSANAFQFSTDWSRDGRFVLYFDLGPGTQEDMWYMRVPPEGKPAEDAELKPYLRTRFREANGRFSPEIDPGLGPRWVAYQSDESGRFEVYVASFPEPGLKTRISVDGGFFPEWGPLSGKGGRELYYVSPDYKLMIVELTLRADSVEPSAPRELFPLPAAVTTWTPYQVTADGQRFLVRATPDREPPRPLTAVVNWPTLLKKGSTRP